VTSAQRARLVLALGVLNLVLASFALAVGITGSRPTDLGVAGVDRSPIVASPTGSPAVTPGESLTPSASTGPTSPGSSGVPGSQAPGSSVPPSAEPSPSPTPSEIIVAVVPTPTPVAIPTATPGGGTITPPTLRPTSAPSTPRPTAVPATPRPTTRPTPKPTPAPTAKPNAKPPHTRPPCPGSGTGPPGHNKGGSADRPCKGGHHGNGGKQDKATGGFVLVVPPLAGTLLGIGRRRAIAPLRRHLRAR